MKIAMIGTGYVGLVSGTCFADMGHEVTCVDIDEAKVAALRAGKIPIYEHGLEHLVQRNAKEGRLSFTSDLSAAVKNAKAVFIAVGTPPGEDGSADLKYVLAAAKSIAQALDGYKVVVNKSTVPVGTGDRVAAHMKQFTAQAFDVVSNPEFLKEGTAVDDFMRPDRVVIGVESDRSRGVMEDLYAPFLRNNHPILFMDIRSAEMTKYASNAMLASRISFMNEVANLCDAVGADIDLVRRGVGSDRRIGSAFLYPGIGYGGSCFPKDVKALVRTAEDHGQPFELLRAVETVNERQKRILPAKIREHFGPDLSGKTFAVWGLAFKPETDDIRESPALVIIEELLASGARVRASDPEAMNEVRKALGGRITYHEDAYAALEGADALILCTEWNEFRNPDFERMKKALKQPAVFDGRNIYRQAIAGKGFAYFGIGIRRVAP
ncbi:MAG: UDP-glucose/GDP-mannose dehydrogenase family protein [Spirochaetes bacterium]|nr:UDP-glucose/GDP-mannose dehydrogenase family protein [Spirochaetota bacterium]